MSTINRILLIVGSLLLVSAIGFVIYKINFLSKRQEDMNKSVVELKQLQDDVVRSQSKFATKGDLDAFAKDNKINLDAINADLGLLNASVRGINAFFVSSAGSKGNHIPSTNTVPGNSTVPTVDCNGKQIPCPDPYGYNSNQQNLNISEQFADNRVPIGTVGFSAWQKEPWSFDIFPRTYNVSNVLGTDENGRHYIYNKFSVNVNNKDYNVKISDSKFVEEYPSPKFSLLNPRLFVGGDVGVTPKASPQADTSVGVSVGLASYGKTKVNPDWSFVQVGVGYSPVNKGANVQISPAQYNVGQHIPFMKNTFVGPTMDLGLNGSLSVGLGMRVGL